MKFFEIDFDSVGSGACVYMDFKDGTQVGMLSKCRGLKGVVAHESITYKHKTLEFLSLQNKSF